MSYRPPADIHPAAKRQIRRLVKRFARRYHDCHDLFQELALHAVAQEHAYVAARSRPSTFYAQILARKAVSIQRQAYAARRNPKHESRGFDSADFISRDTDADTALDVRNALRGLSDDCRTAAALCMLGCTTAEVARRMELSRGRVRGLTRIIAERLREQGLAPSSLPLRRSA